MIDRIEWAVRQKEKELEVLNQHGPVRTLMKDGKKVSVY
jgi:hypothetical protein